MTNVFRIHPAHNTVRTWKINISDLMLNIKLGIWDFEKTTPQKVRINLELEYETSTRSQISTDQAVCYAQIVKEVTDLCEKEHTDLIENLIQKIADTCLEDRRIARIKIKVEKLEAIESLASVGVEHEFDRKKSNS